MPTYGIIEYSASQVGNSFMIVSEATFIIKEQTSVFSS